MDVVAWNSLIMACGQEKWQLAPLLLDAMWWRVRFDRTSARYVGHPRGILAAIAAHHMCEKSGRDIDPTSLQAL